MMQSEAQLQTVSYGDKLVRRRRFLSWLDNEKRFAWFLVAPTVLLLILLIAYPFTLSLWYSVTDKVIARADSGNYIGLQNFEDLMDRTVFRERVIRNSFVYTFGSVVPKLGLGLILAVILNRRWPLINVIRGAVLIPWIVPTSMAMMAWIWMFEPTHSVLNDILTTLHFPGAPFPWLSRPNLAITAVIIINVWRGTPFFAVTLLAALQSVPEDLREAASIDGANRFQRFFRVDLPWIQPVVVVATLFSIIQTFADLQIIWILTVGGPFNTTHVFATYAYQQAIKSAKIGEGAAISLFIFPMLLIVIFLQLRYLQKREI